MHNVHAPRRAGILCHRGPGFEEVVLLQGGTACHLRATPLPPSVPSWHWVLSAPPPTPRQAPASCKEIPLSDLDTPLFPRMAASSGNLNVVEKAKNMTATDCFRSRSTVLQGQPFGGIPTVLVINIILWVVSPGQGCGQTGGLSWGRTVALSQVMPQGP